MSILITERRRIGKRQLRLGGLWQNPDFLKLWGGHTVSYLGSQVTLLALPLTAVLLLNATPVQMGILNAAEFAPFLVVTLFAGVWIDHHRRRPILIAADIGRALLLGLIPLLALMGWLRIQYLIAITFLVGTLSVFFQLTYASYLPSLVRRDQLAEGNGKLTASESIAEIGGPGLAGLLVQAVSAPFAIVVDALSFLVSVLSLTLINADEPPRPYADKRRGMRREIADGLRVTFGNRYLRAFAGEAATYNLFWQMMQAVLVLYVIRELRVGPSVLGAILAVGSVGALAGALLTGRLARRFGIGPTIIGSAAVSGVAPLLIPLAGGSQLTVVGALALAFFAKGVTDTTCNVQTITVRQAVTPDALLGRMNASYRTITWGLVPIGALLGGFLGQWIGLRPTLLVAALGLTLGWLWVLCSPVARLRDLPTIPVEREPAELAIEGASA